MRTLLRRFSEDFLRSVQPLVRTLEEADQKLSSASEGLPVASLLPDLRDTRHHLQVLADKVEEQQAYILIFGPLKSGKSTLMNAISAAYVSEVSALPAYPCMVYVAHGDSQQYTITRFDGSQKVVTDPVSLQIEIRRAHNELADALREVEGRGEQFDPALHYPRGIRRIDVRLPAESLKASGTMLVDTPGLFSRMKFGYDRMTRDFRDSATCAVFVVKSDNLYLENVFTEFDELLDLFSRIFLIVNIDSSKKDLGPEGELVPSLEQTDPQRIVEAFENYAMSSGLKRAAEEGRVQIYPIDLLRAARKRLLPELELDEAEAEAHLGLASFQGFLGDLTTFLNSTEYLETFMSDSLRRADTLTGELTDILDRDEVSDLRRRLSSLEGERSEAKRRFDAVGNLRAFAWDAAIDDLGDRLATLVQERARDSARNTTEELDAVLDDWFQSNASLQSLFDDDVEPRLGAHRNELTRYVRETLAREADVTTGVRVTPDIESALNLAGIEAGEITRASLENVCAWTAPEKIGLGITTRDIPVKKTLWDWLFLRSATSVRRRLFGPSNSPALELAPQFKRTRLGDAGLEALRSGIDRQKDRFFAETNEKVRESILTEYAQAMSQRLGEELEQRGQAVESELTRLEGEIARVGGLLEGLDALGADVQTARTGVNALHEERQNGNGSLLSSSADESAGESEDEVELRDETLHPPAPEQRTTEEPSTDSFA